jgi:photosystem II stability/assembly factor-like uncharacterized protein
MNGSRRSRFFRVLLPGIAVLALGGSAHAASPWAPFGPGGGSVTSLAVDPGNPSLVYATAGPEIFGFGTLYRSTDRGQTWEPLAGPGLAHVALDPRRSSTVCAGGRRLLCSTDGGQTWRDVSPPANGTLELTALALLPGGVILAGAEDSGGPRVLRSADGGGTWSTVFQDPDQVRSIVVDPAAPSRVYHVSAATVYTSTDGGLSWTGMSRPAGGPIPDVGALAVAPSSPATLYVTLFVDPRIFRSDDHGATWRQVGALPRDTGDSHAIVVDPRSPDRVYAASWGGIFASTDGGATWLGAGTGLPRPLHMPLQILALAQAPSQPDNLYAGTSGWGVAWSGSAGAHWRIGVEPGLNGGAIEILKFHPLRPDTVYIGVGQDDYGARSFRSTDGGQTWQPFARAISQDGLLDLAFDPTDPRTLYAATPAGLWKSRNDGETWSLLAAGGRALELAVLGPGNLLAAGCGASRSTNGGRTWTPVIACSEGDAPFLRARSLWTGAQSPGPFYATFVLTSETGPGPTEAYRSWDGGAHWKRLAFPGDLDRFAVSPGDPKVLYAFDSNQTLYRSADAGESWQLVHEALPFDTRLAGGLAVDATDASKIYVGTLQGVLISRDGGRTLAPAAPPFEVEKKAVSRLWTVRTRPGRVYAAGSEGGLFEGRFE